MNGNQPFIRKLLIQIFYSVRYRHYPRHQMQHLIQMIHFCLRLSVNKNCLLKRSFTIIFALFVITDTANTSSEYHNLSLILRMFLVITRHFIFFFLLYSSSFLLKHYFLLKKRQNGVFFQSFFCSKVFTKFDFVWNIFQNCC